MSMMAREGVMRDVKFTVCPVTEALGSVSQMCKTGHRVVFTWDPESSYMEHLETGDIPWDGGAERLVFSQHKSGIQPEGNNRLL